MDKTNRDDDAPKRRAYEAPGIVETAVFETLALQCNKNDAVCEFVTKPLSAS